MKQTNRALTQKVLIYKDQRSLNYDQLAEKLGISKPTLFKRKANHDWKKGEASIINNLDLD